ncbi:MAG: Bax inhibitor-1/YccA family protein [Muribaculaceae bacterium]|nr:Bax inhibitor-1/YccA family protein [Muribaculaceae bacterium]
MYNNSYSNIPPVPGSSGYSLDHRVSDVMKRVYLKMTLGLIVTALVALFCASSPAVVNFFFTNRFAMWVVIIAEFALVFGISGAVSRMSSATATALFYLFAAVNGLMLFQIFFVYSLSAIYKTFFITAGVFGAMSVYGYFTTKDLTKWGTFLIMALFGLIIASVVNIFVHSTQFDWIISIAGVLIFVGLTAWDTQQVKAMAQMAPAEYTSQLSTQAALSLYLDFINLFLFLLRFFGGNRD